MIRSGTIVLLVALGALPGVARAQDKTDSEGAVSGGAAPAKGDGLPSQPALSKPAPELPQPHMPGTPVKEPAPTGTTPAGKPKDAGTTTPTLGPTLGPTAAPVSTKTTGGFANAVPKLNPAAPAAANPNLAYGPGYGYYGAPPTSGGGGGGTPRTQGPNTELKFPDDGTSKDPGKADVAKGGGTLSPATTGGGGGGSSASSTGTSARATGSGDDAPGLPSPGTKGSATAAAPTPAKKNFLEGHVVLFLRAPGDEDPSPAGVKARFSKESKVVKRCVSDVQRGDKPSTKPEEAVLRDAAPQGFYLPDEVDAWLVTNDGALVLLEAEGQTFDKIAALALSSRLNVAGAQSEIALDGMNVTKVKVSAMTTDGTEPRAEGSYGSAPAKPGSDE